MDTPTLRHDWTLAEARALHDLPLTDLVFRAQSVHRCFHPANEVQLCSLLSIKTGGCPEDCAYCPQSAHYETGVAREPLMDVGQVVKAAGEAKAAGATRFCMGAAWREARDGEQFDRVCDMVRSVSALGMETCVTLGMLTPSQAGRLKAAGLVAYNHNLDTSRSYYDKIITTHTYEDRLQTLRNVRQAGITICSGGIIGMGESVDDRCALLVELANLPVHPESVPINALVATAGTPLAERAEVSPFEFVRMIATARLLMPASAVRLSAGRTGMSDEAQALCMLAGANSIFFGDTLLTTENPECQADRRLLDALGMQGAGSAHCGGDERAARRPTAAVAGVAHTRPRRWS